MRLVKVAKALGMTGQQLRHELEDVDFGIKSTDREIPDNLAQGVIRFISRKHGIEVDMEALGLTLDDEAPTKDDAEQPEAEETEEAEAEAPAKVSKKAVEQKDEAAGLNVLRKLSLDNVSKEAIAKEEAKMQAETGTGKPTKAEREEIEREEKAMKGTDKPKKKATEGKQEQIKKKEGVVMLPEALTVKEFAEKAGVQVPKIVQSLMQSGVMATVNQTIDYDTAAIVAAELGVDVKKEESLADAEQLLSRNLEELLKDEPENLATRPPIVVVMGHVDHGKTSILDAVRETDVVAGEAGGITQHIGAYQIVHGKEKAKITFLDTPGHEAFTAMRARGAQVTDIAIIVVAANEGIKPTTIEAINHAQEAGVPIIVAINKMDLEGADVERVKGELAGHNLQAEDWGGQTPTVLCSAKTKMGIDELLDTVVLVSEMNGFKANANRSAVATVIESHLDSSLGPLATVVVNTGTLKTGDPFICGTTSGKTRAMMDSHGKRIDEVLPSGPVRLSGFQEVPSVGDILQVVPSEAAAKQLQAQVEDLHAANSKRSFADLVSRLSEGKLSQLKVVLKADTQGSLEALQDAMAKLATDEVTAKVIHAAIGSVSETDVMMAAASDGIVVAFHVPVPATVQPTAEREGVEIRSYDIVYALLDDIEGLLKGLVEPEEEEQIIGHVKIKEVFLTKKSEQIVGGRVTDGSAKRLTFRLMRNDEEVGTGRITSLKKVDKDVKEVTEGSDCGMRVETSLLIEPDDVLEIFLKELKKKS